MARFPDTEDNGRLLRVDFPETDEKYALGDYLYLLPRPDPGASQTPAISAQLPPPIGLLPPPSNH